MRFDVVELHDAIREPRMLPAQRPACDRKHPTGIRRVEERIESTFTDEAARSREHYDLRFGIWHEWLVPAAPECCFPTL